MSVASDSTAAPATGSAKPDEAQYFFDLSTSARWSGNAVGIVRVERELAWRAPAQLGAKLRYCVYDLETSVFYEIDRRSAEEIIAGNLELTFGRPYGYGFSGWNSWRVATRRLILRSPHLYYAMQRARGRSLSLKQIKEIQRDALGGGAEGPRRLALSEFYAHRLDLRPGDVVLSAGLDWEYKDLRAIRKLKATQGFSYAAVVYDLIPLTHPHFVVPDYADLLKDYFGELVWTVDLCLCISEATKADLIGHYKRLGRSPPPIVSFPLGSDLRQNSAPAAAPTVLAGRRYALCVSTIEPRKNHRTLYLAWDYAVASGLIDPDEVCLVFVGRPGWLTADLIHEIRHNPRTRDSILLLSNVSDTELQRLYAGATLCLFPTFWEGYGLPLAEALAAGKACVASDIPALREIGCAVVEWANPYDPIGWAQTMATLLSDAEKTASIEARVRHSYKPQSWDQAAAAFFDALKTCAGV